ncbi:MAG: chitobiase/beta-hexosaminidase C-terminal domain-containing protein [Lachnospiraceae bacterium]|nr:chitobiase/beta-hexosaminidase C-terminal domain-containing protein [Lachnospiraceae bacterium]
MKCPKCNAEIQEGYLYCQECGEEIRMVPDYEVELDAIIDEGVSDVAKIVADGDKEETGKNPESQVTSEGRDKEEKKKNKETRFKIAVISASSILVISLLLYAIIRFNQYFSYEYQYQNALEYYNIGNYADSIKTAKHALELKKGDRNVSLLMADNYYALSKYDESNAILYNLLNANNEDSEVYDRILENCLATGDYSAIPELIRISPTEGIRNKFAAYMASPPEFSDPSGEYEDDLEIWLTAGTTGTIYYTTDGSEPDENSTVYREPVKLSEGEWIIKALFINDYGIRSDTVTNTYTIDYGFVTVPKLWLQSGSYVIPETVGVDYPEEYTVYYTDDGEDPTEESKVYERPLLMPMGKSEFRFVCMDDRGRKSDVIVATYTVAMNCIIDQETAVNAIKFQLMSRGEDVLSRTYKVKEALGYQNSSFYVIHEYSSGGSDTGRLFAVDTMTGSLFSMKYNEEKAEYVLTNI